MKKILYILFFIPLFCNGQSYLAKSVNGTNADVTGNVTIVVGGAQTLSRTFADSISLSISGGNTVKLPYAVDSVGATSDSIIVYKFGIRKSYTNGASGGTSLSGLTVATATNTIDNVSHQQNWSWNSLTSGIGLALSSSSTAAAGNNQKVLSVSQTGANVTASQTTVAGNFSNTKTGTSGTNIGLYSTASAGSINYAIYCDGILKMPNTQIQFNNSNSFYESGSSLQFQSNSLNLVQTSSSGPSITVNTGGAQGFATGWVNTYSQPYMTLGATREGASQWRAYLQYPVIFQNINGDLSLSQDNGLTYSNVFTPTERVRFKVDGSVGIGTASPNASAILDLTSTTRGFLPPRMTTTQRDAISTPAAGLIIYNTTTNKLNVFTTTWEVITSL